MKKALSVILLFTILSGYSQTLDESLNWIKSKIEMYPHSQYSMSPKDWKSLERLIKYEYKVEYNLTDKILIIHVFDFANDYKDGVNIYTNTKRKRNTYEIPLKHLSSIYRIDAETYENSKGTEKSYYRNVYLHLSTSDGSKSIKSTRYTFKKNEITGEFTIVNEAITEVTNQLVLGLDADFIEDSIPDRFKKALKHVIKLSGGKDEPF